MDHNHKKDDNLDSNNDPKHKNVEKIIKDYDKTFDKFFIRNQSLLQNINKLSKLHHGDDVFMHKDMIKEAHGIIVKVSGNLVTKRNNFLKVKIAPMDKGKNVDLLDKIDKIGKKYVERIKNMFNNINKKESAINV